MTTTFILVDFENVQPTNVESLVGQPCRLMLFVGAGQTKISVEMVKSVQVMGTNAEYIQGEGGGKNALDFQIAYYLGRLAAKHDDASFFIVSRDSGFDPLIKHLLTQGVRCLRVASLAEVLVSVDGSPVAAAVAKQMEERVRRAVRHLEKIKSARPSSVKSLKRSLKTPFPVASEGELDELVAELTQHGVIKVSGSKVSYP